MTPELAYLAHHGHVRVAVTLASFDTIGHRTFDRALRELRQHCIEDGLTAFEAVTLLRAWSDHIRLVQHWGACDAVAVSRALTILGSWIEAYEIAVRKDAA